MGHPIIDGLLIGAAVGVASNMVNQAMQPGQMPVWTGSCPDGTLLTMVTTRTGQYQMWAVCGQYTIPMGSYPNWVALLSGAQMWANYLREKAAAGMGAAAALGEWSARNAAVELERKQQWDNHLAKQHHELVAKRAAKPTGMWWVSLASLGLTLLLAVSSHYYMFWGIWGGIWTAFWTALAIYQDHAHKKAAAALKKKPRTAK
jgi:hypothetical protein